MPSLLIFIMIMVSLHSNRTLTNTEISSRKQVIAVIGLANAFVWKNMEYFGTLA